MVKGGQVLDGAMAGPETMIDATPSGKGGVSQKIQQLLNTLKRPKKNRRPIEEYYLDQDESKLVERGKRGTSRH